MCPIAVSGEDPAYVNPKYQLSELDIGTNEGHLESSLMGWLKPWPADTPDDVLRHELMTRGVVHVKNLMPREMVLSIRKRWFERVKPTGVLEPGTEPVEGIFCGKDPKHYVWPKVVENNTKTVEDFAKKDDYTYLAAKMHYEEWTNEFSGNEYLMGMVKRLKPDWNRPSVLRRQIFRTNMPYAESATAVHYDQLFFRYAPPTALTCWVPIGDCPPSSGGLMYLENSLSLGKEYEDGFSRMSDEKNLTDEERRYAYNVNMTAKGGLGWDAGKFAVEEGRGRKWLLGDYEAGDAVFHHMYTIHASGGNHDAAGRIRFSADLRFADLDQEFDHRWTNVFHPGDGL
ncbi:hypothetical protein JCM24511_02108 [Saitozyma sp. JCM 24511]|nr:hypothetical protein JCM24511_02108 [Saitozyma sp. JCM 24511]